MKAMLLSQQKVINYLVENAKQNGNPPSAGINKEIEKVDNYNSVITKPTVRKKARKGSQPKQSSAVSSSSDSSDSEEDQKKNRKLLDKDVQHNAIINMKSDKNKQVYEEA